jgi:hypothetical protein
MTREDIIRMAQIVMEERGGSRMDDEEDLIAYSLQLAVLVAAAEREACAKVCEEECADPDDQFKNYEDTHTDGWQDGCNSCAWAIRARGQA